MARIGVGGGLAMMGAEKPITGSILRKRYGALARAQQCCAPTKKYGKQRHAHKEMSHDCNGSNIANFQELAMGADSWCCAAFWRANSFVTVSRVSISETGLSLRMRAIRGKRNA